MDLTETRAFGAARAAFWADPPRGVCPDCATEDVILHARDEEGLEACCADCYRRGSVRDRQQACDRCGQGPAFRNPAHRRNEMLCAPCHAEDGYVLDDASMLTKLESRVTHPLGRTEVCIAKGGVTECKGGIKPRAGGVVMCDRHHDPVKWNRNRQV